MGLFPASKKVQSKQVYTIEEVFETLKTEAKLPAEPYMHNVLGMKAVQIPATKTHVVSITVSKNKNKITVQEAPKPSAGNILTDQLTNGWSSIIGSAVSDIKTIVNEVAAEVERIFA